MLPAATCWWKQCTHVMNKGYGSWPSVRLLIDIVRIFVIGVGKFAKAMAFRVRWSCHAGCQLASQWGSTDANGKLGGEEGSQLCGAGHEPLPGVEYLKMEISSFASLLNGHISGELWHCKWRIHFLHLHWVNLSDSNQVISIGGQAILSCSLVEGTHRKYPEMCSARDWLVCDKSLNIW